MISSLKTFLPYFLGMIILSLVIYFTPINNMHIGTIIYLGLSLYLLLNYFNKKDYPYLRQLYVSYMLLVCLYNFVSFSFVSIILSIIVSIIVIIEYFFIRRPPVKEEEQVKEAEDEEEEVLDTLYDVKELEEVTKDLYLKMQMSFMNFDYDALRDVLGKDLYDQFEHQMRQLESQNRKAIRDHITFVDFKVSTYNSAGVIIVGVGVEEDKYTISTLEPKNIRVMRYDSYYEIYLTNVDHYRIDRLNLVYSRSAKKD